MKKRYLISIMVVLVLVVAANSASAQYKKGAHYIGVNATVVTDPVGWGALYEYGFDENIALGLTIRYWGQEPRYGYESHGKATIERNMTAPMVHAAYHFLPGETMDPYAGLRLGYAIYSEQYTTEGIVTSPKPPERASSGIALSGMLGGRYFIVPKLSIQMDLEYFFVADESWWQDSSSVGVLLGINFSIM